jgi:hypothetical protein
MLGRDDMYARPENSSMLVTRCSPECTFTCNKLRGSCRYGKTDNGAVTVTTAWADEANPAPISGPGRSRTSRSGGARPGHHARIHLAKLRVQRSGRK